MPIALEDGFFQDHESHVSSIGIESHRLAQCVERVKSQPFYGVFGHESFGFKGEDLNFLNEMPWVQAVWFWDVKLKSIDGLYALSDLRSFGVFPKRPAIDFARFPKLSTAVVQPIKRDKGLGTLAELKALHYWHFKSKDDGFSALEFPESLTELGIYWANVTSLSSLPTLPNLTKLNIARCRNLEHLGDLGAKFPNLQHLVITSSGRVREGEGERVVRDLPKIQHACVRDRVLTV